MGVLSYVRRQGMNIDYTLYLNDPVFLICAAAVLLLLIICICLVASGRKQKKKYEECLAQKNDLEQKLQAESEDREKFGMQEILIEAQKQQIIAMEKEIEEARKIRHDYRQELLVLEEFARNGDRNSVARYLPQTEKIEKGHNFRLCPNVLVNTLLLYYIDRAGEQGIEVDAAVDANEELWMSAADISVMLGNLMTNAITAAAEQTEGKRKIRLRTLQKKDYFAVAIGNTFGIPRAAQEDGIYSSTKEGHKGIGLSSIRRIAEKYEGTAVFHVEDEVFRSDVIVFRRDYE